MAGRTIEACAVFFDVDGTLVHHPRGETVWQVLNRAFLGDDARNEERFRRFLAGDLSYADWVALDVGDWIERGVRRRDIVRVIRAELAPAPGAREAILELHRRGYRLAVISGTLDLVIETLLPGLPFDRVLTNRVEFGPDGRITGWRATPWDVEGKGEAVEMIAAEMGFPPRWCAFVGDHWNDLAAFARAGTAIAFHPKDERVRAAADVVIESGPLTAILPLLPGARGCRGRESDR